jgi:hypothetical protein
MAESEMGESIMTDLPVFNAVAGCPKCGYGDICTTYCAHEQPACLCWCRVDGEHLHRICRRCGYEWLAACLVLEEQNEKGTHLYE